MENYLRVNECLLLVIMFRECLGGLIEFAPATHWASVADFEPRLDAFFVKHVVARGVKGMFNCFEADRAPCWHRYRDICCLHVHPQI